MDIIENTYKFDFNDFSIHIYIVGGKNGDGEGILVLFMDGDKVIRSISMDCCKANVRGVECNLLNSLLDHYNVKKIDCFVWTHPHDDHSNGLDELIEKYHRKNSIAVIPKQIYGTENDIVNMKPMSKNVLKKFNSRFKKKNLKSIDCQCQEKRCVYSFYLEDIISGNIKSIKLYCLTPMDFLLDDKRRSSRKLSDSLLNDISLSLILDVDGYCYFFGGDAPDKTLKEVDMNYLYGCKWIKIPHHGSKTSRGIVQCFNKNVDSAVTASFLTCQLPSKDVLNKYKDITKQIYITQKAKNDVCDFGMVRYIYSFRNLGVQVNITRYGNAYKYECAQ
jgi:beta-lactamase superfamily II metal-dependent hydrolase